MALNTFDLLQIATAIVPDRTAFISGKEPKRRATFSEIENRARKLATALKDAGVVRGDRVAMMEVNGFEFGEAFFACVLLDAVFVPVNYRARVSEVAEMLHEISPRAVISGQRYASLLDEAIVSSRQATARIVIGAAPGWDSYDALIDASVPADISPRASDSDAAMIMFTSGTSTQPKGVVLTHSSFCGYVMSNVDPADPDPESAERTLLTVPLYHIAGAQAMMAGIYGGRTLVLQPQFEPESWLRLVQDEKVSLAMVVPTMLKSLLEHETFGDWDLSSLNVITYGAAAMPEAVLLSALEKFPNAQFINAFGQTETASTITQLSPADHRLVGTPEQIEEKRARLRSIGRPLPDVEVRIVDETGNQVAQGDTGEIIARGERLMKGYWNQPEATAGALQSGWLHTGDLGWSDEDGYIFLAGRAREFIKRAGEMISPEEVESILDQNSSVAESAVIGIPDEIWVEVVHAIVVPAPGASSDQDAIIHWCRERMASFKRPEAVHFVDELPRSQLGKVMKSQLREQFHDTTTSE